MRTSNDTGTIQRRPERQRGLASQIAMARKRGLPTFVWTVNEAADMRYIARIGAHAIITDRPTRCRKVLDDLAGE